MDLEKIGKFIADRRKEKGLTQVVLAEKLHVSDKAISKWERGICLMDMTLLEPLSKELGVSVNEILAGETISKDNRTVLNESTISGIKTYQKKMKKKTCILLTILYFAIVIPCFAYIGIVVFGISCGAVDNFKVADQFYNALRKQDLESLKNLVTSPYDPNQLLVIVPSDKFVAISPDEFVENIKSFYDNHGKFTNFSANHKKLGSKDIICNICAEQNGKESCIDLSIEDFEGHAYFSVSTLWDPNDEIASALVNLFNSFKEK